MDEYAPAHDVVSPAHAAQMTTLPFRISRCARGALRMAVHRFKRDSAGTSCIGTLVAHHPSSFVTAYEARDRYLLGFCLRPLHASAEGLKGF